MEYVICHCMRYNVPVELPVGNIVSILAYLPRYYLYVHVYTPAEEQKTNDRDLGGIDTLAGVCLFAFLCLCFLSLSNQKMCSIAQYCQ